MSSPSNETALSVDYLQGIHVSDSVLWFDAPRAIDLCFLSHAHVRRPISFKKLVTTPATALLLGGRSDRSKTLLTPFYQRFSLGDLDLQLFPAGHLPGSAQILVGRGGQRLVYTGHFNLEKTETAEQASILETDILVMESTYGLAHQNFPPREETWISMLRWMKNSLDGGAKPIFLVAASGIGLELSARLGREGFSVQGHREIARQCQKAAELGVPFSKRIQILDRNRVGKGAVLLPFSKESLKVVSRMGNARTALVSGLAVEQDATARFGVDAAFPLSSHADHEALLRVVRCSGAKKIYLVGPAATAFSEELRNLGHDAWPLRPSEQMDLFGQRNETARE
jgi:hypothetical protein